MSYVLCCNIAASNHKTTTTWGQCYFKLKLYSFVTRLFVVTDKGSLMKLVGQCYFKLKLTDKGSLMKFVTSLRLL